MMSIEQIGNYKYQPAIQKRNKHEEQKQPEPQFCLYAKSSPKSTGFISRSFGRLKEIPNPDMLNTFLKAE
jgi:hypothetical protein